MWEVACLYVFYIVIQITVPSGYRRISGTQDPLVNNGKAVTSPITLMPVYGAIFVKATSTSISII